MTAGRRGGGAEGSESHRPGTGRLAVADVSSVADVGQMMKARGIMSPEKRAELLAALGGAREDVQAAFIEGFKAGLAELDMPPKEKRR